MLMQVDKLLIVKQPPRMFFDNKVNIESMNMFHVQFGCGYFNERLQHLHENLHIQFQS